MAKKYLKSPESLKSLGILIVLVLFSLMIWNDPIASFVLGPVKIFVITVHELGHALVCILTGGTVDGLTIVSDNQGHGGLTFCRGGMPLLYDQTGYLGTAFFGCLLILVGRKKEAARFLLLGISLCIGFATFYFMSGTLFTEGRVMEGIGSMAWGFVIALALMIAAFKLPEWGAHMLLLFLAVQTALNALADVWGLAEMSFGMSAGQTFSDATNMAQLTHIPAFIWSLAWGGISIVMLMITLWWCYGPKTLLRNNSA
jgi:hypothetical protein